MLAVGRATRIAHLPCSKELYPIGFRPVDGGRSQRAREDILPGHWHAGGSGAGRSGFRILLTSKVR